MPTKPLPPAMTTVEFLCSLARPQIPERPEILNMNLAQRRKARKGRFGVFKSRYATPVIWVKSGPGIKKARLPSERRSVAGRW